MSAISATLWYRAWPNSSHSEGLKGTFNGQFHSLEGVESGFGIWGVRTNGREGRKHTVVIEAVPGNPGVGEGQKGLMLPII